MPLESCVKNMGFNTYHMMLSRLERTLWRAGYLKSTKKGRGLETMRQAAAFIFKNESAIYETVDAPIMIEEFNWLNDKKVIFPENVTLLNRLLKAGSRIKNSQQLFKNDFDSFMLALPTDFKINKLPSTGIMVLIAPWTARQDLTDNFFGWIKHPAPLNSSSAEEMSVCITYQMPHSPKELYYRAIIPISIMDSLINAPDGKSYWQILGTFLKIRGALDLTTEEAAYQQILVRLILAIILYKKTNPHALIPGYPSIQKPKIDKALIKQPNISTLSMPHGLHDSPEEHYRSWYFKQLFADRYYKGEYKHWPKGSRVVFVNETWVNLKEVNPNTLVQK